MSGNDSPELVEGLSKEVAAFCDRLLVEIHATLGSKLYSFFTYGAAMFPHPPSWRVDIDFHVILPNLLSTQESIAIKELHKRLAKSDSLGDELDGYYVLLDDAKRTNYPKHQVYRGVKDQAWALHRAHIHAGRFRLLFGEDPRKFLPRPTWQECVPDLDHQLQYIREHPEHPQYGMLNLARLLYTWTTRNVVVSKYESAQWALGNIDPEWHPALEAAVRDYEGQLKSSDKEVLTKVFPKFLDFSTREIEKSKAVQSN